MDWKRRSSSLATQLTRSKPSRLLWGFVKDKVYHTKVQDLKDLKERIHQTVSTTGEEIFQRIWLEIEQYLDALGATNGAHVEVIRCV